MIRPTFHPSKISGCSGTTKDDLGLRMSTKPRHSLQLRSALDFFGLRSGRHPVRHCLAKWQPSKSCQNESKSPAHQAGLFEDDLDISMHGVDDQISAAQQKDRNADEQKDWHVTLRYCSRRPDNAQIRFPFLRTSRVHRTDARFHDPPHKNVSLIDGTRF